MSRKLVLCLFGILCGINYSESLFSQISEEELHFEYDQDGIRALLKMLDFNHPNSQKLFPRLMKTPYIKDHLHAFRWPQWQAQEIYTHFYHLTDLHHVIFPLPTILKVPLWYDIIMNNFDSYQPKYFELDGITGKDLKHARNQVSTRLSNKLTLLGPSELRHYFNLIIFALPSMLNITSRSLLIMLKYCLCNQLSKEQIVAHVENFDDEYDWVGPILCILDSTSDVGDNCHMRLSRFINTSIEPSRDRYFQAYLQSLLLLFSLKYSQIEHSVLGEIILNFINSYDPDEVVFNAYEQLAFNVNQMNIPCPIEIHQFKIKFKQIKQFHQEIIPFWVDIETRIGCWLERVRSEGIWEGGQLVDWVTAIGDTPSVLKGAIIANKFNRPKLIRTGKFVVRCDSMKTFLLTISSVLHPSLIAFAKDDHAVLNDCSVLPAYFWGKFAKLIMCSFAYFGYDIFKLSLDTWVKIYDKNDTSHVFINVIRFEMSEFLKYFTIKNLYNGKFQ